MDFFISFYYYFILFFLYTSIFQTLCPKQVHRDAGAYPNISDLLINYFIFYKQYPWILDTAYPMG